MKSVLKLKELKSFGGLSLTLASCLLLSACNFWDDNESPAPEGSAELKGYYKDSEVVGLPYQCGSNTDVTGSEGDFFFSEGDSCEFFLDTAMEHSLREIPSTALSDDVVIIETDPIIGQTLQSLDSDGDPENGIDISQEVVEAVVADESFTGVPQDQTEANALAEIIDDHNGDDVGVVTAEEAQAHMLETLLTNNSYYQHCSGRTSEKSVTKIDFASGSLSLDDQNGGQYVFSDGGLVLTGADGSSETFTNIADADGLSTSDESVVLVDTSDNQYTLHLSAESAISSPASSCAFGDTVAPVITLSGESPQNTAYQGTYTDAGATATDNVDTTVTVESSSSVDIDTLGSYTITYSATDAAGNVANEVTRTVVVEDQTAPVISLIGDSVVNVSQGGAFSDDGATATDSVDGDIDVTSSGSVDTSTVGSYTLTYNATDAVGNVATSITRTVNVSDTTAPVITLTGDSVLTVEHGASYSDLGTTATDNVDETVTVNSSGAVNTSVVDSYTITYSAADSAGNNAAPVTRTVNVVDTTPPAITLTGPETTAVDYNGTYTDQGATAVDAVDGQLTVTSSGTVDTSVLGSYTITYNVSDAAGNAAETVTRTVEVTDNVAPVITLNGNSTVSMLVDAEYVDAGATVSDNTDTDLTATSDVSTALDTSTAGTYTVTYNVTDSQGNAATPVTRMVTVVSGIAFNLPESMYGFDAYEDFGNGVYEYNREAFSFNADGTFSVGDSEFIAGDFYENIFQSDEDYILKNGEWVRDDNSNWTLALSELDTVATLDDRFELSIASREDISGESIELEGLSSPVLMATGAERIVLNGVSIALDYEIYQRRRTYGNTENTYYQSLEEVIENQCGSKFFNYVDSPNFYGLSFTCGEETQTSGTLTGVNGNNSFVPNVGTWELVTLPGSSIPAVIASIDPDHLDPESEDGVQNIMYAMLGDEVWEGEEIPAGDEFVFETYNQTAFDAIEAVVLAESVTEGTDEFQVVDGKLSLKSIATPSDIDSDSRGDTSANRYGFSISDPDRNDPVIESFQADINLVNAQTSVYAPNPGSSTRSRIGLTHQMISESSQYRSSVSVFLEHGTNGSDQTIFKAWHSIYDPSGSLINEESLPGIHFETASLNTEYTFKVETIDGGWIYTAGPYSATLLASSFDMDNDGTNESFDDLLSRRARFFNRVKFATEINDAAEGTLDNIVYNVLSTDGKRLTVTQDFDRYANGERPIFDNELFNDIDITTSTGVTYSSDLDGEFAVLANPIFEGCSGASGHAVVTNGVISGEVTSGYIDNGIPVTKVWSLSGYVTEDGTISAGVAATDTSDSASYSGSLNSSGEASGSWQDNAGCQGNWVFKERVDVELSQNYLAANPWYVVSTAAACMGKFEFAADGTGAASFGNPLTVLPYTYTLDTSTNSLNTQAAVFGGASFTDISASEDSFTAVSQIDGDQDSHVAVFFNDYAEAINYGTISGNSECSDFIPE